MGFVPVDGKATWHAAERPRDSTVEFTSASGGRTVRLPVRAALPVLTKARADDAAHPSVRLLGFSALLGLQFVSAGKFGPSADLLGWEPAALSAEDDERVALLAKARVYGDLDAPGAEGIIRRVIAGIVDAMPNAGSAPRRNPAPPPARAAEPADQFSRRLQDRLAQRRKIAATRANDADLPQLVSLALRVEADEDELVAGACRLVLQVHDERNPSHVTDAASLWTEPSEVHGFGDRARIHAASALLRAAEAWEVLDRLQALRIPDQITLDTNELISLLDDGVGALAAIDVPVLWPRTLGRDLDARVVLDRTSSGPSKPGLHEEPLQQPILSADALFAFNWQVTLAGDPLSEEEMGQLAAASGPIIKLRDNWMIVDPATARKAKKRLVRTVKPAQALAAALTGVAHTGGVAERVIVGASLLKIRDQLRNAGSAPALSAPPGLQATLRDYQLRGLTWLAQLADLGLGGVLADDMGLGKTITLISLALHRWSQADAQAQRRGPVLIVCPTSLLGNWEAEIRRFAPEAEVRRFHGSRRSLSRLGAVETLASHVSQSAEAEFVLTTYGTMRNHADKLATISWDLVVADEAQHIKNASSGTAKALRSIESSARVALTGTPVENDLTELWAILDWVIPGLLGSRNAFRKAWAMPIESGASTAKAVEFADLVSPFLLRRRKSDPGIAPELPDKIETDHWLGLTREQAVLYQAYVNDCMERIERADPDARRGLVLKLLTGLKQICNHPAHFLKQTTTWLEGRSEKFDLLMELLGTILAELDDAPEGQGGVLIFTQYVAMARLIERHLEVSGIPHQFLHGGSSARERELMVARFQTGEGPERVPVFLLSLKAGGTGLNLTRADQVIHVDRWWNPAVEAQATDRAHRIGQTRQVQVHRMITQGTVEERINDLLKRKQSLADAILHKGEAALTELSDAELRDLVRLSVPTAPKGRRRR